MARLTKAQLKIYKDHKAAYLAQAWTLVEVSCKADLIQQIKDGRTSCQLWDEICTRCVSITSQMYAACLQQVSGAMDRDMKKGFQSWLTSVGIL